MTPDWTLLDAQLEAHPAADAAEARDVAAVRAFLRAHPEDAHLRSQRLGHLTGSGFVLDAARQRLLLLHHRRLDRWLQPGGHGEGETDPLQIALREVEEETGLSAASLRTPEGHAATAARLFDVDIHRIPERPGEPAHDHLDLRYAFVAAPAAEARLSSESKALSWVPLGEPPAGADRALLRALDKLLGLAKVVGGGER